MTGEKLSRRTGIYQMKSSIRRLFVMLLSAERNAPMQNRIGGHFEKMKRQTNAACELFSWIPAFAGMTNLTRGGAKDQTANHGCLSVCMNSRRRRSMQARLPADRPGRAIFPIRRSIRKAMASVFVHRSLKSGAYAICQLFLQFA